MVEKLINAFEELKKYIFVVDRGENKSPLFIKFDNSNFYHLVGFHKINMDAYFPTYMKSKEKRYKYIKSNTNKFNNIINNQMKEKNSLYLRIETFPNIVDLLTGNSTSLYNLKVKSDVSKFDGDYGLVKIYEKDLCCLLGLKEDFINDNKIFCAPISWMASYRGNILIKNKRPLYIKSIVKMSLNEFDK